MTDIFQEVQEDVRRERVEKLWKTYRAYIIALVVLTFAGIGGWQVWQRQDLQSRQATADQLMAAQRITNPRDAANAFHDLAGAPKGYGKLAKLAQANAQFAAGQHAEAIALYKEIADSDSGNIGMVARLRSAWGQADSLSRPQLADLLAPLTQPGSPWRQEAQEVLAYADYHALDLKGATDKYQALALDPETPDGLRARAKAMTAFLKNGGPVTFGTVPPDLTPAPPGAVAAAPATPVPAPAKK